MRLRQAILFVKDLSLMAAFYGDLLALKPLEETRTDSWVEFETGGANLGLHAIPGAIADRIEITSPPQPREENPVKLVFEVDDVERLSSLGIAVIQRPWGGYDTVDPEGNLIHVTGTP